MKDFNLGLCAIVVALCGAFLVQSTPLNNGRILGASHCTWGPGFWCKNLTNAKGCNAVRHCIQTVWESQVVPQDDGGICKICKDMVTQARDQLRSNETMDEMRQVFEGSCKLIPVKLINKECIKMVDDFIPELVEALSSQMNPDQVCTVAGLCNNARYDALMLDSYQKAISGNLPEETEESTETAIAKKPLLTCGNCNQLATLMHNKLQTMSHDDVLEKVLRMCGQMGSYSDACATIALQYFDDVYAQLKNTFEANGLCHLSGSCVAKYHQHPGDIKEEAAIDLSQAGDDIPCELCEQLVKHLRDVLIANTTETEFKQVLEGLCNQTKNFKSECLSIVDQYYEVIYGTLVNNLDANGACFMIGICPASLNSNKLQGDIRPLLPAPAPAEIKVTIRKKLGAHEPKFTQEDLKNMQLPIDHLMGAQNPLQLVEGGEFCTICEYFLHFVQETLATPATEDEIRKTFTEICDKMGHSLKGHCHDFVDMYGDPIIALLIQGLDPRQVCPKLRICPDVGKDVEVFFPETIVNNDETDKPTCPLCIFAIEEAKAKIKDDRTKKNIENVLNNLCKKLPTKMQAECVDFVKTYYNELLDKLISNFTSKEICVDLNLCPASDNQLLELGIVADKSDESFESISVEKEELAFEKDFGPTPDCLLCEELLKLAEKRMGKHPTKESIKKKLDQTCSKLRPHLQAKCHDFVVKHGDQIAELILKETEPKIVCRELGYCMTNEQDDLEIDEALKYDVIAMPNDKVLPAEPIVVKDPPTCVLCEFIMTQLEKELQNKTTQDEIKQTIEHICDVMPKTVSKSCVKFIEQYSNTILSLIGTMPPKMLCQNMMLCASVKDVVITDDVIECGVCHGAVMTLLPFLKQHLDTSSLSGLDMISIGCENLPAKYYASCSDMIEVYGQSILHLSESNKNEADVCSEIGKCFYNEHSGLAFARISA